MRDLEFYIDLGARFRSSSHGRLIERRTERSRFTLMQSPHLFMQLFSAGRLAFHDLLNLGFLIVRQIQVSEKRESTTTRSRATTKPVAALRTFSTLRIL